MNTKYKTRWRFKLNWFSLFLMEQIYSDNKWHECTGSRYFGITLSTKDPQCGRFHTYYDGPHDQFSLGYLHFSWSYNWCDICYNGK